MSKSPETPIRILIVDDHGMVRFGLRGYLQSTPGINVVGEAASAEEALKLLESLPVDIVLMDLALPGLSGAEATRIVVRKYPQTHVLALTSFLDDAHVLPAIQAGAMGYLLKDIDPDDLVKAIQSTHQGQSILHPNVMSHLAGWITHSQADILHENPFIDLSERELEVLRFVARGLTNHAIADQLMVSENTIRTHVGSILSKLELHDRTQAALLALRCHLVELNEVQPYPPDRT
ncbi:MAG: response regulator transcription factor [Chloroflexota bacterium]